MEAMAKLEAEGKILAGGVAAGKRAGCFIADVSSNDELNALLQGLPFWGLLKWDITPLQNFGDRAAQDRQRAEAMKSSL
jgi:muconolactone delta-isomerase